MKYFIYILLLASVSLFCVPSTIAISPTLSAKEINPKVRAYDQASKSSELTGEESTKSSTVAFQVKTMNKLIDRLHASVLRIDSIQSRITARINKMQKNGIKVTKLSTKTTAFAKQFNLLKKEMDTIDKLTESFLLSSEKKKDYEALRSEIVILRGLLYDSLVSEKAIIIDTKALDSTEITPIVSKAVIKK
jgi:hypothetical protein